MKQASYFAIRNWKFAAFGEPRLWREIPRQGGAGYIALSTVLIITSVVLFIATTITYLSIGEGQSGLSLYKGEEALHLVEGCAEDYLLKIRTDAETFVPGNVTRPEGTCTITVNSGHPNWDITVSTTDTNYKRQIQVIFTQSPTGLTLTSWKEI